MASIAWSTCQETPKQPALVSNMATLAFETGCLEKHMFNKEHVPIPLLVFLFGLLGAATGLQNDPTKGSFAPPYPFIWPTAGHGLPQNEILVVTPLPTCS